MATTMRYHQSPRIMSLHQVCSRDANKTLESDGPNKGGKSKYVEHKKLMREKKRKGEGKREKREKRVRGREMMMKMMLMMMKIFYQARKDIDKIANPLNFFFLRVCP